jgi:hypothetical protein
MIRMPWRAHLPFEIIVLGAVLFLVGIFVPQLPALAMVGAVVFSLGLGAQFLTWDERAKALRAQLETTQGLQLTREQVASLLENQVVHLPDGRDVHLRFHGSRTLELVDSGR